MGPERQRRRRPAAPGRGPDDGEPELRRAAVRSRRPERLGRCPDLRDERQPGESLPDDHAGEDAVHRLRRPHDHRVDGGSLQPAADRVRGVVSAAPGADLRSGEPRQRHEPVRPRQGRQRPAASPDPGPVGAAGQSGGHDRDRRAADRLPGRSRRTDRLVRTQPLRARAGGGRLPRHCDAHAAQTSSALPAPNRARCGRSIQPPGSRTPRIR